MTDYTRATQIADIARAFEAAGHVVSNIRFNDHEEYVAVTTSLDFIFDCYIGSDDDDMLFTCSAMPTDSCQVRVLPTIG